MLTSISSRFDALPFRTYVVATSPTPTEFSIWPLVCAPAVRLVSIHLEPLSLQAVIYVTHIRWAKYRWCCWLTCFHYSYCPQGKKHSPMSYQILLVQAQWIDYAPVRPRFSRFLSGTIPNIVSQTSCRRVTIQTPWHSLHSVWLRHQRWGQSGWEEPSYFLSMSRVRTRIHTLKLFRLRHLYLIWIQSVHFRRLPMDGSNA